jgi:hypothetical protein
MEHVSDKQIGLQTWIFLGAVVVLFSLKEIKSCREAKQGQFNLNFKPIGSLNLFSKSAYRNMVAIKSVANDSVFSKHLFGNNLLPLSCNFSLVIIMASIYASAVSFASI